MDETYCSFPWWRMLKLNVLVRGFLVCAALSMRQEEFELDPSTPAYTLAALEMR